MLLIVIFSSLLAGFALALPSAQKRDGGSLLTSEIDDFILSILTEWGAPGGVAVAAVKMSEDGSWSVDTKGYGKARSDGSLVDSETMFAIGSNSKQFTAISTGLLLSNESLEPRLTIATKLTSIFPESWDLMDGIATSQSTMVDLFSHRTGLPRHDFSYSLNDSVADMMSRTKYLKPSLEFRDGYQYNNIMYGIMSYLPTVLLPSRIPFARYVKQNIFEPLGLSATYSPDVASQEHVLAQGFGRQGVNLTEDLFGTGTPRTMEYWAQGVTEDGNAMSGPGGIIMNAQDMAVWLQMLLLGGANPTTGEQVIPAEVIAEISTGISVASPTDEPVVYGAGQAIGTYRGYASVGHDGGVPGFYSVMIRIPSSNLGVAVLTNDDMYGLYFMYVIRNRILDELLGLNVSDTNSVAKQVVAANYAASLALVPSPSNASAPRVAYADLAGTYSNGGYGDIDFCYVSDSSSCQSILSVLQPDAVGEFPTLIAQWNKLWVSHIRLVHFDGDLWNATLLDSRPVLDTTGQRTGDYWNIQAGGFTAQFAFDEAGGVAGFGLLGDFWGAGWLATEPTGETVQTASEVWFDKSAQ